MALVRALCFLLALAAVCVSQEKYSDRFDGVDIEAILGNKRLLGKYTECFEKSTNDGCSEDAIAVKGVLSEALINDCARCTDAQRGALARVAPFLAKNNPESWKKIQAKYDPSGTYTKAHPDLFN